MGVIPGAVDTDRQPPTTIPLRHFLVAIGLLLLGAGVGLAAALDAGWGYATLAHVHLLLAGWICVTIMGAMTQFVPVWSGTELHSRRLATAQLWLVVLGLLGVVGSFLTETLVALPAAGLVLLAGFWTFVYNVARTLPPIGTWDVTERHFALALSFFVATTGLGVVLAVDLVDPLFRSSSVTRPNVVAAHATLAVFGAILTTVVGALYQLATMFTQTDLHGVDVHLRRFETVAYPVGVVLLAGGRLVGSAPVARVGGVAVALAALGVAAILARRLVETRVEWTPMLSRYAVVAGALALWALPTLPVWADRPLAPGALFGAPGTVHLLAVGVVGFVVLGTLYHIVPFIVWVGRYSDLLGFEDVPMIDDLYDDRIAAADFTLVLAGGASVAVADAVALSVPLAAVGGVFFLLGAVLFLWNLLSVVRTHSPYSVVGLLVPALAADGTEAAEPDPDAD